jgi:hypothetical protein
LERLLAQIHKVEKVKIPYIIPIVLILLPSLVVIVDLGEHALELSGLVQIQAPYGISVTVDGRPPLAR